MFEHLTPSKIIITNLFRDQLDRYGEIDITAALIDNALSKVPDTTELIINGDDPLTVRFGHGTNMRCTYFGVTQDVDANAVDTKEAIYCPLCGETLNYDYYHYSQLGKYHCKSCGFKRPEPDFEIYNVSLDNSLAFTYKYNDTISYISVNQRGFYNIYNIAGALITALQLGISVDEINSALNLYKPQIGRMETFLIKKPIILNLSKNPAGFNQAISTILRDTRTKNVLIIINDNAQDGKDISWLWDVNFEVFKNANVI